jgi:signal transduction histidine kinase/integral membrane sensor domain MASE1
MNADTIRAGPPPAGAPPPSWRHTLMLNGAVAVGCYAAGRLGLLLAIPPGYATAVSPAAGVALAAMLLAGRRVGPGVFLGSLLADVAVGFQSATPSGALLMLAILALAATAQAGLGAFMIRRTVGYSNLLVQELDVAWILLLGGPLACLLEPAVGAATLWLAGELTEAVVWLNLWTWWVGNSIGVLVFAPLVLVWAVRPYRQWRQRQLFVTVPLVGLFLTVLALFVFVSRREEARIEAAFESVTAAVSRQLQEDLSRSLAALGSLEGFYASSENIEEYEFQIFAARLLEALPVARALAWAEVVPGAERARFEQQARAAGHRDYRIAERDAAGRPVAMADRPLYVPVRFAAPLAGNESALGFDVASEASRREALEEARDTGRVTATRRVMLVLPNAMPGMLAFMPVYRHGVQPNSIVARRRYIVGFAIAVFRLDSLLGSTLAVAQREGMTVRLYDDDSPGRPELLFEQQVAERTGAEAVHNEFRFNFAGRPLRLTFELPAQALLARRSWETWFVLAGGLLLTSLVGMLLLLGVGRAARVEALVAERTAELRRLNASLMNEAERRRRLEAEAGKRAGELTESNAELQRRAEVNRQLLRSLRHSEAELRRTASQLSSSNRELEQFAYVASHDLKAPLRSIGSFAQLLERRYADKLGGEAREFLTFIQGGIRQMQALIDDLLQLSRVDPRRIEATQVDMAQVVDRVRRQLTADLKASRAQVHTGALPEVHADANMLAQLLQNLISNAVKFQPPGGAPEVWVDASEEGDYWHFTVRDNGIGIDPAHLDQIFLIFKRLHTTDEFPGSGIGLAVCKKVVNLHGGEIWAESAPGQGTTFHFTLPRAPLAERAADPAGTVSAR